MYIKKSFLQPLTAALLMIFFSVLTGLITAQATEAWRYGYRETPGEVLEDSYDLIAYTLSGEVATVIEGLDDEPRLFNLGESQVLALVEEDEVNTWYEIIGTDAASIDIESGDDPEYFAASVLISYRAPYALLSSGRIGDRLVVIDLENHTARLTEHGAVYSLTNCCVVTEAGTVRYYAQMLTDDGRQDAFIELDPESGEERILFDDENRHMGFVNQSGDQWLLFVNQPDAKERTTIVWQDGEEISRTTAPLAMRTTWIGDALLTNDALCEENCEFTLQTRDGETITFPVTFPDAGEGSARLFYPNRFSPDGGLLGQLNDPDQIVKITTEGEIEVLGNISYQSLTTNGSGMISSDGRFAAVVPDPDEGGFAVIDTETGEAVIRSDVENVPNFANVLFFPEGALAVSYTGGDATTFYYRVSDQQLFEIASSNLRFVEVVDDETLLYFDRNEDTRLPVIGLYTLDTGERQTVVEGVFPLPARPALR